MIHFGGRIDLDAKAAFHQPRRGLFEFGHAIVGVAAIDRLIDLARHHGTDRLGGHLVVLADAEVNQFALGMLGHGLALGPLDLLEFINLGSLAVIGTADPLGEQGLKVGIAHRSNSLRGGKTETPLPLGEGGVRGMCSCPQ